MKKKISLLIMCILSMFLSIDSIYAKQVITLKECEYTEAFKEYMKLSDEEKAKTIMPMMCKSPYNLTSSLKASSALGSITDEKFDLREFGKVTSVKDQGNTGGCWTFAANAAVESNLLVNGYGEYDLSEAHIKLSMQNSFKSPFKSINRTLNAGGNSLLAAAYYLNYWGAVSEKDMPYSVVEKLISDNENKLKNGETIEYTEASKLDSYDKIVDVGNVDIFLNSNSCSKDSDSTTFVKKNLINNGAVTAVYHDYSIDKNLDCDETTKICKMVSSYQNGPYYYYKGISGGNHAITIVGWDDTISKDNFSSKNKPTEDGAWIVKNSWGTGFETGGYDVVVGDEGYYYISYEDSQICSFITSFNDVDTKLSDNVYSYDYLSTTGFYENLGSELWTATEFTKNSNSDEEIDKIVIGNIPALQKYTIYYKKGTKDSNNELVEISTGMLDNYGYKKVNLSKDILVDDTFTIIVKHESTYYDYMYLVTNQAIEDTFFADIEIIPNVSFLSTDGENWVDTSTKNFNPILKVYTNNVDDVTTTSTTKQTTTSTTKQTTTSTTKQTTTSKKEETTTSKKEEITTSKTTSATTKKTTTKTTTKKKEEVGLEVVPNEKNEESYIDTTPSTNVENKNEKENDEKNPSTLDLNVFGIVSLILVLGALIPISIKKIIKK